MQSLNNNFNLHRLERYLTLSWQSGAIPVIILTKRDLVEDYESYVKEVESIAIGVDIYGVSCKTKEGIEDIKKYFVQGKTIVFLGSSGVGKSTLVNTLYGQEIMKTSEIREDDSRGKTYHNIKKFNNATKWSNDYRYTRNERTRNVGSVCWAR